jgi:hypothetical protein
MTLLHLNITWCSEHIWCYSLKIYKEIFFRCSCFEWLSRFWRKIGLRKNNPSKFLEKGPNKDKTNKTNYTTVPNPIENKEKALHGKANLYAR